MKKIGIFDSGIGGLTVLEELKKILPKENFLFYQDSLNNPYGNKSDQELLKITENITNYLIDNDCKMIVIACNTATTRCISYLRKKYKNIIFIGTEPAIKVACDKNYHNILVIGTKATIDSKRIKELVKKYQKINQNIYLVSCPDLANAIELNDVSKQESIIKSLYNSYQDKNIDVIVLACTHYIHIKDLIKKYFFNVDLIDGNIGVANECKRQLEIHNLLSNNKFSKVIIINSKNFK